jgi:fatty-acyl-CoA synthase
LDQVADWPLRQLPSGYEPTHSTDKTMHPTDWIGKWADYQPNKVALRDGQTGEQITYGELDQQATLAARWLSTQLHLQCGDRLAVLADFSIHYVVLMVAAQKTGIILVPLNYRLSGREIDYLLSDSKPSALVVSGHYAHLTKAQPHALQVPHHILFEQVPALWLTQESVAPRPAALFPEQHPLFILYTSGTTGFPKGAIYTHQMAFWNSINTALRLDIQSQDHTLICMPPFHTGGWNVLLTPFLHHGASVTLLQKFDAVQVMELLEKESATLFMAVPTMLKMMAQAPGFHNAQLQSLRYLIVGGEPMPIPLIEKWHRKGVPVRQGFGMTEAGPNLFSLHQDDAIRKIGSIGKPNFYVETRIVAEDGQDVPTGEVGELLIRGPIVTPGYWQNPEATQKSFAGDWFCTGDLLRQDEEGYFYVVDRKKNMYISGGENVYPAEVEHFLRSYPDIAEVAIVSMPDEKWGEVGKAFVVLKPGTMASENDILAFCKGQLAKYKVPKYIQFINELPRNHTGKIDHRRLATTPGSQV